jgi:hypothetical protein
MVFLRAPTLLADEQSAAALSPEEAILPQAMVRPPAPPKPLEPDWEREKLGSQAL